MPRRLHGVRAGAGDGRVYWRVPFAFVNASLEGQLPAGDPAAGTARTMNRCGAEPW